MKYLFTNSEITPKRLKSLPFKLEVKQIGNFYFYTDLPEEILENESFVGITEGYLRDLDLENKSAQEHTFRAYKNMAKQWPFPENITGSFSTVLFDKNSSRIIICNDLIGPYPLYFLKKETSFFVSNSIILMAGITRAGYDEVGVLQRAIGLEFSNIGSRTILKNCKRLLPGEYIKLDAKGRKVEIKYDNSLFQNISSSNQKHQLHKKYWAAFMKEVDLCLIQKKEVKVALSGGIDSRVVLGAIPGNKKIHCLTFGAQDNYETKVASRLASIKKADFNNFYEPGLYFPPAEVLKKHTLQTEAVQICSWLEIMENVHPQPEVPMLMGDLCEALPARNIKKYASRRFRQKNFLKYFLLKKDYEFEIATPENFKEWKNKTLQRYLNFYRDDRMNKMQFKIPSGKLKNEVKKDLEELFSRIEAHNLPYAEFYDELFSWFTHTRMYMAKQILVSNICYRAICPPMSMQILRNTSNIHPNLRLNYRFAKKLFRSEPELKKLNKVPTGQAPLIPQNFPDFIKFPVWGARSKIDNYLIKKKMKSKSIKMRYRLFKSVDWAAVYQIPEMEKNLKEYFKTNHLGDAFFQNILAQCIQRKELKAWPFANIEIINAAALNIEIDIIDTIRRKHSDNIKRRE